MDKFVLAWLGKLRDWENPSVRDIAVVMDESESGEKWVKQLRITNNQGRFVFVAAEAFALGLGFRYETEVIDGRRRMTVMTIRGPNGLFFEIFPKSSQEVLARAIHTIGIRDKSDTGGRAVSLSAGIGVVKEERKDGQVVADQVGIEEARLEPA